MTSTTSSRTIEVVRGIFASYGLPKELVSDNGPQLASSEFREFLQKNGVKHTLVPAYHPASNGAAERSVQIVKSTLKKHLEAEDSGREGKRSFQQRLDDFLLTYRITPQRTTGRTPAELFLKRELRTRFALLRPDLTTKVRDKQEDQAKAHDCSKIRNREFQENEIVSVRNYFGSKKWERGKVLKRLGRYWYIVQVGNRCRKAHVEQLLSRSEHDIAERNEINGNVPPGVVPNVSPERPPNVPPEAPQNAPPGIQSSGDPEPARDPEPVQTQEPILRRSSRKINQPKRLIEEA